MKTLNEAIKEYTSLLNKGEIQIAYKGIMDFMGKLRADFIKKYPDCDVSSIYQGYMDMSYFSLISMPLKALGLKIAVVYLHQEGAFEVWLSARNREIAEDYSAKFHQRSSEINLFHDHLNPDAIVEYKLTSSPDFENQKNLMDEIDQGVTRFNSAITNFL